MANPHDIDETTVDACYALTLPNGEIVEEIGEVTNLADLQWPPPTEIIADATLLALANGNPIFTITAYCYQSNRESYELIEQTSEFDVTYKNGILLAQTDDQSISAQFKVSETSAE